MGYSETNLFGARSRSTDNTPDIVFRQVIATGYFQVVYGDIPVVAFGEVVLRVSSRVR
jgi:hypothetical protein